MPTVLFVCTGNTCRSPMAAALFSAFARRTGRDDVRAESAGVAAMVGAPAAEEARSVVEGVASLEGHRARQIDGALIARADLIVGVTRDHALRLQRLYPRAAARIVASADLPGGQDVRDPYLLSHQAYADARRHLERFFPALLAELDLRASGGLSTRIHGEDGGKSGV
ncbi:MAG: low molecular weight protein arginine phosphatase [bacterium]|nr:low molecular weight protein arginine phosphatase [bacterium]